MDGGKISRGQSKLHFSNVLKLKGMVDQEGSSQKFEAHGRRAKNANPLGGRKGEKRTRQRLSPAEATRRVQKDQHSTKRINIIECVEAFGGVCAEPRSPHNKNTQPIVS